MSYIKLINLLLGVLNKIAEIVRNERLIEQGRKEATLEHNNVSLKNALEMRKTFDRVKHTRDDVLDWLHPRGAARNS